MAKTVLRDCYIEVAGVPFSDHVSSVTMTLSKNDIDTTNFGGSGTEHAAGLKSDMFELNFQQDFAAASVDETLYPLYDLETEFSIVVRPHAGAKSPTNPEYSGTCLLLEYAPLDGKVGDLSETKIKFPTQRNGITRTTS